MYRALRWALFRFAPERIHTWVFALLRAVTALGVTRAPLKRWLAPTDPMLASTVFGVRFAGPMGLAAGFDKDGRGLETWGALGFGFAEVGTVTAQAQPGNPKPRLFRLPDDRALLNRMGFNNHGAGELAIRLARHDPEVPIGVNIGKTKTTPPEPRSPTTRKARGCSARWRSFWWSMSAHRTPRACVICRPSTSLRPILAAVRAETRAGAGEDRAGSPRR